MEVRVTTGTPHGHFRWSKHVTTNKLSSPRSAGRKTAASCCRCSGRLAVPLTSGSVLVSGSQRDDAPSGHSVSETCLKGREKDTCW